MNFFIDNNDKTLDTLYGKVQNVEIQTTVKRKNISDIVKIKDIIDFLINDVLFDVLTIVIENIEVKNPAVLKVLPENTLWLLVETID